MDFDRLFRGALPTLAAANISHAANSSPENGLPDGILDTLSPLLGLGGQFNPLLKMFVLLYNMVGSHLGLDPTYVLTAFGFVWALNKLWAQLYASLYALARQYFMAKVEVSSTDDIYCHLMKWLASQPSMVNSRSLTAETASKGAWEDEDESELMTARMAPDGSGVFLNFSHQEAKAVPRFTPALGRHSFWFRGRYFNLQRTQESLFDPAGGAQGVPAFKDKETLVLSCFGRSPEPIKKLLQHAKEEFYLDHRAKTIVRRPAGQTMRRYGHRHSWQQVADRPVRPMKTVVLDDEQKVRILSDMNEYLHPATPRWYANRGIPLRRGYLFHGPPGTGKTSLSFALAGVFGLDIYVISLLDPTLTEEDLLALFTSLPRRCVVLLEDIDTAGLKRPEEPADSISSSDDANEDKEDDDVDKDAKSKKPRQKNRRDRDWKVSDLARELKRHGSTDSGEKKGISLSGLLNAIDGVASHEGRVLIMTTNKPEALDEALIRPGRVDLQVGFTQATQEQARELFVRMYEPDSSSRATSTTAAAALEGGPVSPLPSSLPPLTPFSEAPPTPFSFSSDKDGNMTDVSGATEVEVDAYGDDDQQQPSSPFLLTTNTSTMNTANKPAPLNLTSHCTTATSPSTGITNGTKFNDPDPDSTSGSSPLPATTLSHIAAQFAARIPPGAFSPAELQGFLLKRKKAPRRALAEVDGWVAGMLALKAGGRRVLDVQ